MTVLGTAVQPTPFRTGSRIIGGLLLIPALAAGVWQLLVPAIQTVRASFFAVTIDGRRSGRFRGLAAYVEPGGDWLAIGNSLIGLGAFVVAGTIGLAVGVLAGRASLPARLAVRALLGVMTVLYAPVGVGLALRAELRGLTGAQLLFWVLCVALLPLGSALTALTVMSAVRPEGTAGTQRRFATVTLLAVLGLAVTLALGLQMAGLPTLVAGPLKTLGGLIYSATFQYLNVARGAAISTVMLVLLGLLGIVVTVVLLGLGFRVELASGPPRRYAAYRPLAGLRGVPPGVAALVAVVLALLAFFVAARSWVVGLTAPVPDVLPGPDVLTIIANTWLPKAIAVAFQLLISVLAGVGIGALRPLGRYSEWLLILFAPGPLPRADPAAGCLVHREYRQAAG
jgi:ABC-type sugar transport system permease subunit